jgi:hypothetical protein
MRRVISFIGGLDLTDGRYDNPEHSLFGTIKAGGVHNGDFYQPSVEGKQLQAGAVWRWARHFLFGVERAPMRCDALIASCSPRLPGAPLYELLMLPGVAVATTQASFAHVSTCPCVFCA